MYYIYESDFDSLIKLSNRKESLFQWEDSLIELSNKKESLFQWEDSLIISILQKAYNIYQYNSEITQIIFDAFSSYLLTDMVNSFDALLVYNRVVHDNIMYCIINEPIKGSTFGKTIDNVINNQELKGTIDNIINSVNPPTGGGDDRFGKSRSSSLAKVCFDDKTVRTYLSISGICDRGLSKNSLIKRFLSKPALCLSTNDRTKISLVNAISKAKNWELCFLDHYTESYYSFFTLDKQNQKNFLLQKPINFLDDLRQKAKNKQLNDKNQKYNGRLFSCGERKIISYILYPDSAKLNPPSIIQNSVDMLK